MQRLVRNAAFVAVATAALLMSGVGAASADTGDSQGSILSGNNLDLGLNLPATICGLGVSILGIANAEDCDVENTSIHQGGSTGDSNGSVLSGNNLDAFVFAPITVCGNAVAVLGIAHAKCKVRNITIDRPSPTPTPTDTPTPTETPNGGHRPPPDIDGELPTTGSNAILALPIGLALLAGGFVLYRRFRGEPSFGPTWD